VAAADEHVTLNYLVRDYEQVPETLTGLHLVAFATLMLHQSWFLLIRGSP
jgi:hypothetical protein